MNGSQASRERSRRCGALQQGAAAGGDGGRRAWVRGFPGGGDGLAWNGWKAILSGGGAQKKLQHTAASRDRDGAHYALRPTAAEWHT